MVVSVPEWRGRVNEALKNLEDDVADIKADIRDDIKPRVGAVEKFMWKVLGAALVGSILGGGAVTVIAYLIVGFVQHHG